MEREKITDFVKANGKYDGIRHIYYIDAVQFDDDVEVIDVSVCKDTEGEEDVYATMLFNGMFVWEHLSYLEEKYNEVYKQIVSQLEL